MDRYMTKYEKVRILGTRATQISLGANPTVDIGNLTNAMDIAKKELKEKTLPLVVVRNLPNGTVIEIPISKLIIL
jgi:DNA-directed RNA polymerase I, II, and III subunit RPABC2